jgi:glycosyltransferase involved in cell wall biosynthesis
MGIDVSVIVPTRNRRCLLAKTLRSALQQQGVVVEIIVVDDASTDETPEFLTGLAGAGVRVIRHDSPRGLSETRNHGASEARGEWVAFLDDDDLWAPDKLCRQIDAARETRCGWAYTGAVNLDGNRIVFGRPPLPPEQIVTALYRYNAIPGGGSNVIVKRSTWLRVGLFETRFPNVGEDWEMSLRLAKHGLPAWVCHPLVAKRIHPANASLNVTAVVRAAELLQQLHDIQVDWGRLHRWLAERYLRSGQHRAAFGQLVRAAVRGQARGAASDALTVLRRHVPFGGKFRPRQSENEPWKAAGAAWLREFEGEVCW